MARHKAARSGRRARVITAIAAGGVAIILLVTVLMMREVARTRAAIDSDVARANTVAQYIVAADRYAAIGERDRAERALAHASRIAASSDEDRQVATAYRRLRRGRDAGPR
jgi:hypothetical protein